MSHTAIARPPSSSVMPRVLFASAGAFFTFVGDELGTEGPALWYQTRVAGVPIQYIVLAAGLALCLPFIAAQPKLWIVGQLRAAKLWTWVALGYLAITVGLGLGITRGTDEPFVDWRNWAVIAAVAIAVARWLAGRTWRRYALTDLMIAYGALAWFYLLKWALGGGSYHFDLRVPLLDGYDLTLAGTAAVVATESWINKDPGSSGAYTWSLRVAGLGGAAVVLLSFRRSLWLFLLAGIAFLYIRAVATGKLRWTHVAQVGAGLVLASTLTVTALGLEVVGLRVASINPFAEYQVNPYAATNEDHMNDLIDAWDVLRREPIFGLGIGVTYETNLIAGWKTESFDVHNAFLHAWLKFGLLGLVSYAGFHFALVRAYVLLPNTVLRGVAGAGAALAGEQIVGLVQPWPYTSFQFSLARALILGVFLASWARGQVRARSRHPQLAATPTDG